ncbi:MAG TPA: response regulator [Burkholderiales bacterium]|nr:response regulator [Burkholderiales bacterium]
MTTAALKKVLVVDDDPIVGKSIDRILSPRGYAVIAASSGPEALDKLAREEYDVVYTDIKMPGMDGLEVAARIRASRPWLPVVIVTGYGSDANEAKAKEIGVTGFLRKPLSPEMVETSAHDALLAPEPAAAPVEEAREAARPAPRAPGVLRSFAMLVSAPFLGFAFVVALPFVGLGMLAWTGLRAASAKHAWIGRVGRFAGNVALFLAAPFIGLAYAIAFPFIGLGLLGWHGYRALMDKEKRD